MELQGLIKRGFFTAVGALLICSCSQNQPVKPSANPEIDSVSVALARFASSGAIGAFAACMGRDTAAADSAIVQPFFTLQFIQAIDFGNPDDTSSFFIADTVSYGILYPWYWNRHANLETYYDTIEVVAAYDSPYTVMAADPAPFREFDALSHVEIYHYGYFSVPHSFYAEYYKAFKYLYYYYPVESAFDSVVVVAAVDNQSMWSKENTLPDTGSVNKIYYLNRAGAVALGLGSDDERMKEYLTKISEYYHFSRDNAGVAVMDTVRRLYQYAGYASIKTWIGSRYSVVEDGDTLMRGEFLTDTTFTYVFSSNGRVEGIAPRAFAYSRTVAIDSTGDPLSITVPSGTAGNTFVHALLYRDGVAGDSVLFSGDNAGLSWTGASGTYRFAGAVSRAYNGIYLAFSCRDSATGKKLAEGACVVDRNLGSGQGYVRSIVQNNAFDLSIDVQRSSYIENCRLR